MRSSLHAFLLICICGAIASAQTITVSPGEATVYSQGATSVFLTFGNLGTHSPVESTWCGALIPAAPDIGMKCDPATIFGRLPLRYNQSRLSGNNAYTDIMSVTPSVARRAYLDAARGVTATFYYVRRFASTNLGADEFVPVTLRLAGNGAAVPFSLTNVRLLWDGGNKTIPFVKSDQPLPRITAEIFYTGTGRLIGRWEIVKPGEEGPTQRDLLPQSSLPVEERGTQRRFSEVKRFNVFLAPGGRTLISGPEDVRIEKIVAGNYLLLLRIEVAQDGLNRSDWSGQGTVDSGGVAGFAMPVLRYYVGAGGISKADEFNSTDNVLAPADDTQFTSAQTIFFSWPVVAEAKYYRIEIADLNGAEIFSAILLPDTHTYRAPPGLFADIENKVLRWRVIAYGSAIKPINETQSRTLRRTFE
ncbi:MAG TPA: hypothetical protein VGQ39_04305 [Pyrinomonadaceae bacterium]|jgi:hypothetical protein|nr:hypothetical protein [Pyrinomonadaceae bacterium]